MYHYATYNSEIMTLGPSWTLIQFLKMLNDASCASFRFLKNKIFPNRIRKEIYYITQYRVMFMIDMTTSITNVKHVNYVSYSRFYEMWRNMFCSKNTVSLRKTIL